MTPTVLRAPPFNKEEPRLPWTTYDDAMPLYIVRWPGFRASLVKAQNEEELVDVLDEVADPAGCKWAVYRGPLWIDFDIPLDVEWEEFEEKPIPHYCSSVK
jgi:hypothetical protein